uniref:Malic enzyme NAD-binding domain-containing protein n=1 Tax=Graphocephala atropunctata TaxID=36148 RepID=A0A1B6KWL3_9HEMI
MEARNRIWMMDIDGLLAKGRPEGRLEGHKQLYAKEHAVVKDLLSLVKEIKPTILIGASAAGGAFTPEVLREMANNNDRPIIFALSNPTSKAECTAEQAYVNTDGRCIFSSGSPFPPVEYNGKTYNPGQGNNAYIFPGVALGAICAGIRHISDEIFLIASSTLAQMVSQEDLDMGSLYPPLNTIQSISTRVATRVAEHAYEKGLASTYPEPEDKGEFIKAQLYDTDYRPAIPSMYSWPQN